MLDEIFCNTRKCSQLFYPYNLSFIMGFVPKLYYMGTVIFECSNFTYKINKINSSLSAPRVFFK